MKDEPIVFSLRLQDKKVRRNSLKNVTILYDVIHVIVDIITCEWNVWKHIVSVVVTITVVIVTTHLHHDRNT